MICVFSGGICGTSRSETIPCEQGGYHPRCQPLRLRPWPRSSRRGPNVRDPWTQRRLPRLVQPVLPMHVPCCVRTSHMYVCYATPRVCVVPWITRYTPTAVYLTFRFICGYCGSAFLSVAGGSVSDMFSNSEVAMWVVTAIVYRRASLMGHWHDLGVGRWPSTQYARFWAPS